MQGREVDLVLVVVYSDDDDDNDDGVDVVIEDKVESLLLFFG